MIDWWLKWTTWEMLVTNIEAISWTYRQALTSSYFQVFDEFCCVSPPSLMLSCRFARNGISIHNCIQSTWTKIEKKIIFPHFDEMNISVFDCWLFPIWSVLFLVTCFQHYTNIIRVFLYPILDFIIDLQSNMCLVSRRVFRETMFHSG